jgi:hypothetical protein
MNNENQGRNKKRMERNQKVAIWAVWGLFITFISIMILSAFGIIK